MGGVTGVRHLVGVRALVLPEVGERERAVRAECGAGQGGAVAGDLQRGAGFYRRPRVLSEPLTVYRSVGTAYCGCRRASSLSVSFGAPSTFRL